MVKDGDDEKYEMKYSPSKLAFEAVKGTARGGLEGLIDGFKGIFSLRSDKEESDKKFDSGVDAAFSSDASSTEYERAGAAAKLASYFGSKIATIGAGLTGAGYGVYEAIQEQNPLYAIPAGAVAAANLIDYVRFSKKHKKSK